MELDRLDRLLLDALQTDATQPLRSIADKVHASLATCQRRIARLREAGVIVREVAIVDPARLGRPLTVFVSVELGRQNEALLRTFERTMQAETDVLGCHEISGEADFMLVINCASMADYHAFTRRVFTSDNNVRNFKSNFVMHTTKNATRIPATLP